MVTVDVEPPAAVACSCRPMAAPPKIASHRSDTTLGTSSTPVTSWRMVRPRLVRVMNIPTKGVQLTHQAQ